MNNLAQPPIPGARSPQATTGSNISAPIQSRIASDLAGSGRPLEGGFRRRMEKIHGHDLGSVRVHASPGVWNSADLIGAHAYTVGNDIVVDHTVSDTQARSLEPLLHHEVAHVVQFKRGGGGSVDITNLNPIDHASEAEAADSERGKRLSTAAAPLGLAMKPKKTRSAPSGGYSLFGEEALENVKIGAPLAAARASTQILQYQAGATSALSIFADAARQKVGEIGESEAMLDFIGGAVISSVGFLLEKFVVKEFPPAYVALAGLKYGSAISSVVQRTWTHGRSAMKSVKSAQEASLKTVLESLIMRMKISTINATDDIARSMDERVSQDSILNLAAWDEAVWIALVNHEDSANLEYVANRISVKSQRECPTRVVLLEILLGEFYAQLEQIKYLRSMTTFDAMLAQHDYARDTHRILVEKIQEGRSAGQAEAHDLATTYEGSVIHR